MPFHDKQGQFEIWKVEGEKFDSPFHRRCVCPTCGKSVKWTDPSGGQDLHDVANRFGWVVIGKVVYCNPFCAIESDREGVEKLVSGLNTHLDALAKDIVDWSREIRSFDEPPIKMDKERLMAAGYSESDAERWLAIACGEITGCCQVHEPETK